MFRPDAGDEEIFLKVEFSGTVLIVEDNVIIAMDVDDLMRTMGASDVVIASNVSQALEVLGNNRQIDFALLDFKLGNESSLPVAESLARKCIPFAFVTGYGEIDTLSNEYPIAPVVQKPFSRECLAEALEKALGAHPSAQSKSLTD